MIEKQKNTVKFLSIAITCFVVYLVCYATKNLLSVNTPFMIEDGYGSDVIGIMSSIYFLSYGTGQLFVGIIGDKTKLKYMLLFGLGAAGIACYVFVAIESVIVKSVVWGVCGFGLAFLYAPLVKYVSDHLSGKQAETCMVLLNFASILGSTIAGVFGAFGNWKTSTIVFASVLIFLSGILFFFYLYFDKKFPVLKQCETEKNEFMPIKQFAAYWLKNGAVAFILISAIQGIAKNSITFWIPTYISDYLRFNPKISSIIFSVMTLISAANQIIAIWLYHLMKEKIIWVIRFSFFLSTICFSLLLPVKNMYFNLILLLIANSGYSWAGTMVWTYYCRGFKNVNRVAFVVGFLDFISYAFSAIGNLLFSEAIVKIGWVYLIVIWVGIMFAGVLVTFFYREKKKEKT